MSRDKLWMLLFGLCWQRWVDWDFSLTRFSHADRKLRIEENHLVEMVNEVCPNANYEVCGNAGQQYTAPELSRSV